MLRGITTFQVKKANTAEYNDNEGV